MPKKPKPPDFIPPAASPHAIASAFSAGRKNYRPNQGRFLVTALGVISLFVAAGSTYASGIAGWTYFNSYLKWQPATKYGGPLGNPGFVVGLAVCNLLVVIANVILAVAAVQCLVGNAAAGVRGHITYLRLRLCLSAVEAVLTALLFRSVENDSAHPIGALTAGSAVSAIAIIGIGLIYPVALYVAIKNSPSLRRWNW